MTQPVMTAEEIVEKIKEGKRKKIRVNPQHVVRASEIGHPCERYLVYSITHWQDRKPHTAEVQFIFEGGNAIEDLAIKDFEDGGFKVYRPEPDRAIMEAVPKITGHLDVRVDFGDGTVYTGEIKGLQIYDWQTLHTIQDFHNSKKPWIRKYPGQLMTYMYIKNEEWGFFYIKSIPRFQPKYIWVKLDYDYMEELLKKTERVNEHVKNQSLPEPISDITMCEYCQFKHICLPTTMREGMKFVDDAELLELLDRWHQLKGSQKEYAAVDRKLKEMIKEQSQLMIGDYIVTGNWIDRKEIQAQPASKYWKSKIINLSETEDE